MAVKTRAKRRFENLQEEIGERIRDALKKKELTQKQFAGMADTTVSFLNRVMKGKTNLTLQTICTIEDALGYELICVPKGFEQSQPSLTGSGSISSLGARK